MPLPDGIPTVQVTGRYLTPDGRPLSGRVVWRAPLLTFPAPYDVILGAPVYASLDAQGRFEVLLPATDAPDMNPSGWSYTVAEQLDGIPAGRSYQVLLPADTPQVDIADIAPTDPTTPNYVAVKGDPGPPGEQGEPGPEGQPGADAYEVAVTEGFVGTRAEWLASLIGPQGEKGDPGGGGGGGVQSVNGLLPDGSGDVALSPATVGAVAAADKGAPGGVATLDTSGVLTAEQRPTYTAAQVGALASTSRGAANGVASLDESARVPVANLPILSAVKSADTPRTTAALAADPDLTVSVAAGARYIVLATLVWTAATTKESGGMNAGWIGPSGATMAWTDNDSGGAPTIGSTLNFGGTLGTTLAGVLVTGGTAGTFALRWAQNTPNSTTPTVLKVGSGLTLLRVA
ncbi:hypothetical protein [Streptomyces sp. SID2888]|uniref:hypothetical protein n=1 Tax=Streptomyces sp. SID2888 TaxID=2690256 RepID=UPI00136F59B0|nr:hypothetical protein [Streptomyces sp. SID2888]MYV48228.1 hypothetical protein [Streptomyces sp. SID2888]